MTAQAMRIELHDATQGRTALTARLLPWIGEQLRLGREIEVVARELQDNRSLKQNAFLWGYVLKAIKDQATIGGIGADEEGWNLYFKRRVLGYRVIKTRIPGSKRPSVKRELRSTKDLKVKPMSDYLEQVMAIAASEFGVTFGVTRWEDYEGCWR